MQKNIIKCKIIWLNSSDKCNHLQMLLIRNTFTIFKHLNSNNLKLKLFIYFEIEISKFKDKSKNIPILLKNHKLF